MNLRHLEVFIEVVECGQITRAAQKLYIAQPSVSQTIAEIEREYGVKLFERLNKKLYLTAVGKVLYERAKPLYKNFKDLERILEDSSKINALKIGATVTVGASVLPQIVAEFTKAEGASFEKIVVDNTENIIKKIADSSLDAAIIEGKASGEDLVIKTLCRDDILFVASGGYDFTNSGYKNFIVREEGSGTREMTLQRLEKNQIKPENLWEMSGTEAIKNMLKKGNCVTAISNRLIKDELNSGEFKKVSEDKIVRSFYLIYHKDKNLSGVLEKFIAFCESGFSFQA